MSDKPDITTEERVTLDELDALATRERRVKLDNDSRKLNYSLLMVLAVTASLLFVYIHAYVNDKTLPEGHMVLMSTIVGAIVGYLFGDNARNKKD